MRSRVGVVVGLGTAVLVGSLSQAAPAGAAVPAPTPDGAGPSQGSPTVSPGTPATAPPAPLSPPHEDALYRLPESAIASADQPEPFEPRHNRFWKVPRHLVPFYEEAARDYQIPVRYLAANGSWESLFNPKLMGDGRRSCGIHQFHHFRVVKGERDWTLWGFASLEECQDPRANIRMTAKVWRSRIDNTDPAVKCNGFLSCAIRMHMGRGANSYMRTIMNAGDRLYAAAAPVAEPTCR